MPKEPSNKRKRARDSLDVSVQPRGLVTGGAGAGARFKNPFSKGAVSTRNATSTEITKPYDAGTASFIPLGAIPPHPPQSYDGLYAGFQHATEPPEEHARSPTPGTAATETNAGISDAALDPSIIESDVTITSLIKAKTNQQPGTGKQLNDTIPMCPTPASRFSLTTSKRVATPSNSTVTNSQVPAFPNGPKSIQSVSNAKAATIPKWLTDAITRLEAEAQRLQEEVDNNRHTIQDQNREIKMLHDEVATLQEAQGQNTKDVGEIRTGLQSLSSTVTEVVGRLETINVVPLSLGDVKPIVTKPITEKKRRGKQSPTGEVTFVNERDNTWNTAVRRCFLKAVGVNASREIKTLHPHSDGAQIKDDQVRPDFTKDWGDNSAWHAAMVTYVSNNIRTLQPMITAELFEEKKESIFEQLHKVFKHYAKEYRDSNGITLTHGAKPKGKSSAQTTRRDGRKRTKAEERVSVRDQSELHEAAWDFLFSSHYQSTDESAEEDRLGGIDPGTDEEQQVNSKAKPVAKRKAPSKLPWITRRPAYRAELVNDAVRYLDDLVNKAKPSRHERMIGNPREKDLPVFRSGPRIPEGAIDGIWLTAHPQDGSRYIQMPEEGPEHEDKDMDKDRDHENDNNRDGYEDEDGDEYEERDEDDEQFNF